MGLILDSSVLITAERQGRNARQMLTAISGAAGDAEIAISNFLPPPVTADGTVGGVFPTNPTTN